jgi:transcriptional regulator with XRE-family HTH domain
MAGVKVRDMDAIAVGMEQLRAEQRALRLAEMRRRLGITQAQVASRMGITQGRASAIEHAKAGATELRTLAAYVEALGGRLEIIADFGDQRLAFIEPRRSSMTRVQSRPSKAYTSGTSWNVHSSRRSRGVQSAADADVQ